MAATERERTDRARSRFGTMTTTQLRRACARYGVEAEGSGCKRMASMLVSCEQAVAEIGCPGWVPKDLKRKDA